MRRAALDWREVYYTTEDEKKNLVTGLKDSQFQLGMPNIKYLILRSKKDESVTLCIKVDHGSYDGMLQRIFDEQFRALARGDTTLPKIEPFRNFIDWVHTADRAGDLAFWKAELAGYTPPSDAAFPRAPVSDRLQFVNLAAEVDAIADRFGVTPSTVFQAAYALTVGRLTRTDDVLVNNLITGRNAGVDDPQLVNGTCANFLPFRTRLGGGAGSSAADFFRETQRAFWDSTEHGSVGLVDIYGALGKDRGTHAAKMLFCFQPFEPPAARAPGEVDHMRWLVMAQSKVMMTVNYVLMVEVQKTSAKKYRLKMQWDSRALSDENIGFVVEMFNSLFGKLEEGSDIGLESLLHG